MYLDAAKIDEIRAAATTPVPLNGASFSTARGTLEFDLWPRAKPEAEKTNLQPIFDDYDGARNHIFMRHDDTRSSGSTLGMQIGFQSVLYPTSYIAVSRNLTLTADQSKFICIKLLLICIKLLLRLSF